MTTLFKDGKWVARELIGAVFFIEGYGDSEEEAIEDCKERIKDMLKDKIMIN